MARKYERILVLSRAGHYNLLDPSQESISTHIAIMSPDGTKKMSCNIRTECEIDEDYDLVAEIDGYLKRMLWCSDKEEIIKVRNYIEKNHDDLYLGNLQYELVGLEKKNEQTTSRIDWIEKVLKGQGYFEKGVWVE